MPRFFVTEDHIEGGRAYIDGGDYSHIANVLRMKKGEELTLSAGNGTDYFCSIEEVNKAEKRIELAVVGSWKSFSELPVKLYLFQGLPKADKMELIVQKAVELGAYAVVPVATERAVVKLDAKGREKKQARWQAISESAAKQAGRAVIPEVLPVMSFKEALEMAKGLGAIVMPYEKAEGMEFSRKAIKELHGAASAGIFIGPEGGFSEAEAKAAEEAGARIISLGKRILRTETAGMTVLSIIMFELEEDTAGNTDGNIS
ncbi:MAG: 16S rRNA (uracil(1498)-N(3))-methyltransferase [Lachnospiraceae bacterium]|nr:16S rRNA (uracil(1498)-N(3))-methyltransferase [Lachnospiraceae bacterium]